MYFLKIGIDFVSSRDAKDFFASIKPELDNDYMRSKTKISLSSSKMNVEFFASDKTALRASFNALLKPLILFVQLEEF
jgi:tRNA threonylcarbamoyladenosine modification (KEOPS) complex  Pcc1 subunit